jgi:hypothetical protein
MPNHLKYVFPLFPLSLFKLLFIIIDLIVILKVISILREEDMCFVLFPYGSLCYKSTI